jgi:hypothetical protein
MDPVPVPTFEKVTVPVPVPAPAPYQNQTIKSKFFQTFFGKNVAFLRKKFINFNKFIVKCE